MPTHPIFEQILTEFAEGARRSHRTYKRCPACGSTEKKILDDLGHVLWARCRDCGIDYQVEDDDQ